MLFIFYQLISTYLILPSASIILTDLQSDSRSWLDYFILFEQPHNNNPCTNQTNYLSLY